MTRPNCVTHIHKAVIVVVGKSSSVEANRRKFVPHMQRPFAAADDDGWPKTCVMANPHAIAYQFGGKKQASITYLGVPGRFMAWWNVHFD